MDGAATPRPEWLLTERSSRTWAIIRAEHSQGAATVNFAFSEEQEELRNVVRQFLEAKSPESAVREQMDTEAGYDSAVWTQMAEQMGLQSLIIPEEYGGSGYSFVELTVVLEEMGRRLLAAPYFSTVVLAANALIHSGDDAAKKANCMAKATKAVKPQGFRFERDKEDSSVWWFVRFEIKGTRPIERNRLKAEFSDDTGDKITIETKGPDQARPARGKGPKSFEIELPDEYTLIIQEPGKGKMVYEPKLGLFDET